MPPRTPLLIVLSLIVLLPAHAEILERVIAKVNGDIITQTEFENRQVASVQAARIPAERVERYLRENNARILQDAVDELLLVQRADELGLRMRPEYINEVIDGIKKENNIESDEQLQEQLRREGMSLDDLKRNVERSIIRRQIVAREIESKVNVTEADVRKEYETRKADYTHPATVKLQEILIRADSGDAKKKAQELAARARAGEDFAALARAHSQAPTGSSGGDLGRLARGEITPDLEKIAFALEPGQVSDPFPSGEGYRILKVIEKTEGSITPFEDVKAELHQRVAQERMNKEYTAYMEGLRKNAIVDIRVREVPLQLQGPVPGEGGLELGPEGTPTVPGAAPAPGGTPAPAAPSPPPPARPGTTPPGSTDEFSTTPQARPERVAPPPAPGTAKPAPAPSPTPSPTPTPR